MQINLEEGESLTIKTPQGVITLFPVFDSTSLNVSTFPAEGYSIEAKQLATTVTPRPTSYVEIMLREGSSGAIDQGIITNIQAIALLKEIVIGWEQAMSDRGIPDGYSVFAHRMENFILAHIRAYFRMVGVPEDGSSQ